MPSTVQFWLFALILLAFVGLGILGYARARRLPFPPGSLHRRGTELGNEVVVIDAPGSNGQQRMLIEACATATLATFLAWRTYRPSDYPPGIQRFYPYPIITVHFIDDALMNELEGSIFEGRPTLAYLSDASSAVQQVPLVVIRKSCAPEMMVSGQPLIDEVIRALANFFRADEQRFAYVHDLARAHFKDHYAPEGGLQKR